MDSKGCIEKNEKGHLVFDGCDAVELAKEYGTPLYVISESEIRKRCKRIKEHFTDKYTDTQALYASKAMSNLAIYKIIGEEGMGIDVVSGGELYTAIKAGFPAEKIYFHGNNKTPDEIKLAIDNNIGCFVIDNDHEIAIIQELAHESGKKIKALLRITPGVSGHTHEYISTGQIDSKFGFSINDDVALNAVKEVLKCPNIHFAGIHCHIGSNIYRVDAYREAVKVMTTLALQIKQELGVEIEELNMGGGFGVYDHDQDKPVDIVDFIEVTMKTIEEQCSIKNLKRPRIIIEPGRWIVGESGITLYTIGAIKDIKGIRKYVSVDGGMADNPRHALYKAVYKASVANKVNESCTDTVTIAGKCCESGDILIRNLKTPILEAGDILAVYGTGAYNYSMSSNYNRLRRPALVMVNKGKSKVIVRRETYEDLIKYEML
ncbi:MAG TPA: diaminopimelate decarboxylase [Clostridia bacterium]|nr:diaminopimelate decarboxylase [Clostridia bacterium]